MALSACVRAAEGACCCSSWSCKKCSICSSIVSGVKSSLLCVMVRISSTMLIDASQTVQCSSKQHANRSVTFLELLSNYFGVETICKAQPQDWLIVLGYSCEASTKNQM